MRPHAGLAITLHGMPSWVIGTCLPEWTQFADLAGGSRPSSSGIWTSSDQVGSSNFQAATLCPVLVHSSPYPLSSRRQCELAIGRLVLGSSNPPVGRHRGLRPGALRHVRPIGIRVSPTPRGDYCPAGLLLDGFQQPGCNSQLAAALLMIRRGRRAEQDHRQLAVPRVGADHLH